MTMNEKNDEFFTIMKKLSIVREGLFRRVGGSAETGNMELCLTELYFRSLHIVSLIRDISEAGVVTEKESLENIFEVLISLQNEIFTEMLSWSKTLRQPLQKAIDQVEEMLSEEADDNGDGRE